MTDQISAPQPKQAPMCVRSSLIRNNERFQMEQQVMGRLEAGSGLLGTTHVNLELKKAEVCKLEHQRQTTDILAKLAADGVYTDDPEVHAKFTDINIQKLEERLLNNGHSQFFKYNGELKLDNDLLDDEPTRPVDLAFDKTVAGMLKETNAILSNRMHAFKKQYFRLDVVVGKVSFSNCKNYFCEEDRLALDLKEQFKLYETRVSLAMIPFYLQRLTYIQTELDHKLRLGDPKSETDFLANTKGEVERKLDEEKRGVQALATQLYETWTKIDDLRKKNDFQSTNVQLKVHQTRTKDGTEYTFNLTHANPSIKTFKGGSLPNSEASRRSNIKGLKAFARLYINGQKVSETQKQPVKWPSFEAELCEMFQVHVFTMPSSIWLELVVQDGLRSIEVDRVDVEVPGQHVMTLTCAAQLVQQLKFSKLAYERSKVAHKFAEESQKPEGTLTEAQTKRMQEAQAKAEAEEKKLQNGDITGQLFVKAEWMNQGPLMPPVKSENIFKRPKSGKNRREFSQQEETLMLLRQLYIDVNDPRNEHVIRVLRETKNEYLVRLLFSDSKNLLADSEPFRHKLLKARNKDVTLKDIFVPMLEAELIDSSRTSFYLHHLETLFRDEAYIQHLNKRVQLQDNPTNTKTDLSEFKFVDLDTLRRRQAIFDKIKEQQHQKSSKGASENSKYKSVVKEVDIDVSNPFVGLLSRFMVTERKLKPHIKTRHVEPFEDKKEVKIFVHVIKGENVPVRADYIRDYRDVLKRPNVDQQTQQSRIRRATASMPQLGGLEMIQENDEDNEIEDVPPTMILKNKHDLENTAQVETYVEVKVIYHEKHSISKRTNVDEGSMPKWNEVLQFPLEALNMQGFTKEELANSGAQIVISLFDKQMYLSMQEGKQVRQEENRFLGSVTVPLVTVLCNPSKLDYNFKLERPVALSAYRVLEQEIYFMNPSQLEEERLTENEQISTYLHLSINLDPMIELPAENSDHHYPGAEPALLLIDSQKWVEKLTGKHKNKRPFQVFGENLRGHSVLLCRYLRPLKPPTDLLDLDRAQEPYALEKCARFVSMIPFINDLKNFKDLPDMYTNCQEFLDLGGGDSEEHAILLANFFQYIDDKQAPGLFKTYLVFGYCMPEGRSVFVMRKHKDPKARKDLELWSPLTGDCYSFTEQVQQNSFCGVKWTKGSSMQVRVNDPICPLKHIYSVVSAENVFANIQQYDFPVFLDYDFTNNKKWKPLLASEDISRKYYPQGLEKYCVQPQTLLYTAPMDAHQLQILTSRVQKYLIEEFQDERIKSVRKTTKWAVQENEKLRAILEDCEQHALHSRKGGRFSKLSAQPNNPNQDLNQDAIAKELTQAFDEWYDKIRTEMHTVGAQERATKRCWGFPVSTTFKSLEAIWKLVAQTKIHTVNRQDVEFSLSVHIAAYPCNVLAIWVFLAAFVDSSENLNLNGLAR